MTISRDQQLDAINKITAHKGLRSLVRLRLAGKNKRDRQEWRRERVQFLVDFVSTRVNAGIINSSGLKATAQLAFEEKYGSALLTFLAFQLIWYLIQKYLLNR